MAFLYVHTLLVVSRTSRDLYYTFNLLEAATVIIFSILESHTLMLSVALFPIYPSYWYKSLQNDRSWMTRDLFTHV